jgi:hypothetical protein
LIVEEIELSPDDAAEVMRRHDAFTRDGVLHLDDAVDVERRAIGHATWLALAHERAIGHATWLALRVVPALDCLVEHDTGPPGHVVAASPAASHAPPPSTLGVRRVA